MNRKMLKEMAMRMDMSKVMDMGKLKGLRNLEADDVLDLLGLQRKGTDWAPAITALGVGLLVGAGIGLLLAPKSGADLRDDLRQRLTGDEQPEPRSIANNHDRPAATPR